MRTHRQSTVSPWFVPEATRHVGVVGQLPEAYRQLPARLEESGIPSRSYAAADELTPAVVKNAIACLVTPRDCAESTMAVLREHLATVPFIVAAENAEAKEIIRAFDEGARGYFLANSDPERLLDSVHRIFVEQNELWWRQCERHSRLAGLSEREREVLDRLVAGQSVKMIARELGIRPSTAEKHRARILLKTGFDTVIRLVSYLLSGDQPAASVARTSRGRVDLQHRGGECHAVRQSMEVAAAM